TLVWGVFRNRQPRALFRFRGDRLSIAWNYAVTVARDALGWRPLRIGGGGPGDCAVCCARWFRPRTVGVRPLHSRVDRLLPSGSGADERPLAVPGGLRCLDRASGLAPRWDPSARTFRRLPRADPPDRGKGGPRAVRPRPGSDESE